ncbi:MAG TPA: rhomboid family intramembrane serine protease [Chthoniobacterales bacterium]
MTWLDKLERRIGFIAIPGLIRAVVALTALVYVLTVLSPEFLGILDLNPARIRRGEVWRLVTYIFLPSAPARPGALLSPLFVVMALMVLWMMGDGLERAWGAFRLTLYFLVGMIGTTIAAFLFGAQFSNSMLATSLLFAFAWFYPDEIIYVLFILPVKWKWLAWFTAALVALGFIAGPMSLRMATIAALSNFLIFFGPEFFQRTRHRQDVASRRKRFEVQTRSEAEPLHKCATCGATELTDPSLDFRVSRNGEEYCMKHLPSAAPAPAEP